MCFFYLDPDPYITYMDPYITYTDPKHCFEQMCFFTWIRTRIRIVKKKSGSGSETLVCTLLANCVQATAS